MKKSESSNLESNVKVKRGFNFYWRFKASPQSSRDRKKVEGIVQAKTSIVAVSKIKKMGFSRPQVRIDIEQSIRSGFGWLPSNDFDLRDKARLYETLSRRLQRDGSLVSALESAQEYLSDGRLKASVAILASQVNDGQPLHKAMVDSGFPIRDSMVVKGLSESGQSYQAFHDLSVESKARHQREQALSAAMRMPIAMLTAVYFALPAFFLGLGPRIATFFKRLGSQNTNIPDSIKTIYAAVDWVNLNIPAATLLWLSMGFASVILWKSSLWTSLSMRIKAFRDLAFKAEHASIWSVYGLMYSAGIPAQDICLVLRPTARLPQTSDALRRMSRRLAAGGDDREAIQAAGFPKFVVTGYRAARDSGALGEGLKSFTLMLNEDIEQLTAQTKAWLQIFSLVIMAMTVLGVFYIVYYPIAGPILKSL